MDTENSITGATWSTVTHVFTVSTALTGDYNIAESKMPQAFQEADDERKRNVSLTSDGQALVWKGTDIKIGLNDLAKLAGPREPVPFAAPDAPTETEEVPT